MRRAPFLVLLVMAALLSGLALTAPPAGGHAGTAQASIALLAVDTQVSGNGPRAVGEIDDCVSAAVGEPVDIDVVIPDPGIPGVGMAAFQFTLLYDPAIVWVTDDRAEDMLLAQAGGSSVVPIAEPKPDTNGIYQSWGVDFGSNGVEPAGSSETGPGVISRMTLLPQGEGIASLTLSNVLVIDDASERITLQSIRSGIIAVGEACPGLSQDAGQPIAEDTPTPSPPPPPPPPPPVTATPSTDPAVAVPTLGGAPPAGTSFPWLTLSGILVALAGATILVGVRLARSTPTATESRFRGRAPRE